MSTQQQLMRRLLAQRRFGGGAGGNSVPNTPTISHGTATSTGVTLTGSAFSDPDVGDTHAASQWQVTGSADTGFASPVISTGDDAVNKTSYTASGLTPATPYIARVRYKDNHGNYSAWATATSFTTSAPSSIFFASNVSGTPNTTLLQSVTPDTGTAWVKHADATGDAVVTSGRFAAASGDALYAATPGPTNGNCYVQAVGYYPGGFNEVAIVLGMQGTSAGTQSRYEARLYLGDGQCKIVWRSSGGGVGTLATASGVSFTTGSTHTLRLERTIVGGNAVLRVLLDGVEIIAPFTDSSVDKLVNAGLTGVDTTASAASGFQIISIESGNL